MTPEQSQKLLDRVKEGCPLPWEIFTTETIEGDPREVKNVRCNDPRYDGHLAYSVDYEGTTEIDPDAIELIAAAPALAELVAGLYVEYAVQDTYTGLYVREKDDGQLGGAAEPSDADWWQDAQACADYVKFLNENPKQTVRMVSRLVSEVAE